MLTDVQTLLLVAIALFLIIIGILTFALIVSDALLYQEMDDALGDTDETKRKAIEVALREGR